MNRAYSCRNVVPLRAISRLRGFTLVELVMVILVLGVISAIAIPRMVDTNSYNERGLYDETIALLRYAQKTAIAQRRTVCVTFTTSGASLNMASNAAVNGCAASTALAGPRGEVPAAIKGQGTASYASTPAVLNFNGLGMPVNDAGAALAKQTITVTNGPADISVEAVTGYVQ